MRTAPPSILATVLVCALAPQSPAIDLNKDQMSDVWQSRFNAFGLPPFADSDGDGFTNLEESILGTDPLDPASRLYTSVQSNSDASMTIAWRGLRGKRYKIESSPDLVNWTSARTVLGTDQLQQETFKFPAGTARRFLRVRAEDMDSDGDGLTDWEERILGLDPKRVFSEGLGNNPASPTVSNPRITDFEKATAILNATTSTITVSALDPNMAENWPDPGLVVFRRSGWESRTVVSRLDPITVNFTLGGTATPDVDYVAPKQRSVRFEAGQDEAYLELIPIADNLVEGTETITVTLLPGTGYTVGSQTVANLTIKDSADGKPSLKEASRFLQQATFGPCPNEVARVQDLGISAWLEEQFQRPIGLHKPILDQWQAELADANSTYLSPTPVINTDHRIEAFWRQAMRSDANSDPVRQRAAFALSQIFVISDRNSTIGFRQIGVAGYQDVLLTHSFGSYRALLEGVTRHPWMGVYLSAIGNRKANPAINRFPDENYAREVMQLFSIGLWLLNPDGSRVLSNGTYLGPDGEVIPAGEPIPTYGQSQIETLARVFTGLNYGTRYVSITNPTEIPTTKFYDSYGLPWAPMRIFDVEHDVAAKTITLPGHATLSLPARTASSPDTGAAGDADLSATLDWLSNHPNVGPFICRQLIQRLVTSNPTPAYISRVSSVFANNGSGVRGDLRAVFRAILMDSEARDPAQMSNPRFGQVREPYTRYVSLARALEAAPPDLVSSGGRYRGFSFLDADFLQRPLSAPSVFNFYSPDYSPLGELLNGNLVSPELQIMNGVTAILLPNRFGSSLSVTNVTRSTTTNSGWTQFNPSTQNDNTTTSAINEALWNTRANEDAWLPLGYGQPDALVSAADSALCAGRLSPASFRTICRAVRRLDDPNATGITAAVAEQRALTRLRVALHLVAITPECAVLR
ncbi:MAG: DUF1800 family protein [Verrucomicrobiota bacterium]